MKILVSSHFFAPSVGGIQEVSGILCPEFVKAGAEVKVVTQTTESSNEDFPFEVVRKPSPGRLLELVRWCDVFFHNNVSLQTAWPLLLCRKPWVVAHHSWICRGSGRLGIRDRLKLALLRHATRNISVSRALADGLGLDCTVIGNPYRDDVFFDRQLPREREMVFLGRFTPDKGAHVLLAALQILKSRGITRSATLVGMGPERQRLERDAAGLDVHFVGACSREDVASLLNHHRIMVVPSTIEEPFGIAAVEGIACGCLVIGSAAGGLPDAIGPCGMTFEKGNARALADLLAQDFSRETFQSRAPEHLAKHRASVVAAAYFNVIKEAAAC